MSDTEFTVFMHPTLVDELDLGFSPLDGLVAIDQIFRELPRLHPASVSKCRRKRAPSKLKVYRGRYDWYGSLCFSYVQTGNILHVLELWIDDDWKRPNGEELDVVLGRNMDGENRF